MCRNIKTLFNFEPPATEPEIRDAALQFVRKISGFNLPSRANQEAFDRAVQNVADAAHWLVRGLVKRAGPRHHDTDARQARVRATGRLRTLA